MKDKNLVIFMDYFENLEKIAPLLRKKMLNAPKRPIVVSMNFNTSPLVAVGLDAEIVYSGDLLEKEDYEAIDRYVLDLNKTWYLWLRPAEGITECDNIRFGSLTGELVHRSFSSAIKRLEIVLKIIERFDPDEIILAGDSDIFKQLSFVIKNELGIKSEFIMHRAAGTPLAGVLNKIYRFLIDKISNACDVFLRKSIVKRKINSAVLMDRRLYPELPEIGKDFLVLEYMIEQGLRIRLQYLKNHDLLPVPLYTEDSFKMPGILGPYSMYWRLCEADKKFREKFVYKKIHIWKLVKATIQGLVIHDFPRIHKNIDFLKKLYARVPLKVIVMREAVREIEKTIVLTARQAKIQTLVIQHGLLCPGTLFFTKFYSDKIALWGRAGIDWFAKYGNDVKGCVVTGKPAHDLWQGRAADLNREGGDILGKVSAYPEKDTVLYITACFKWADKDLLYVYDSPDAEYISLKSLLEAMRHFPEKQLVIKMHPFDLCTAQDLYRFVKGYSNVFVVKDENIMALIAKSAVVITSLFSSAGLDAVIFKKALVTLNLYKRDDLIPFADYGVALGVRRQEDLLPALRRVFKDKGLEDLFGSNRDRFISDYAYKIDGGSTERVIDLIKQLCNKSNLSETK